MRSRLPAAAAAAAIFALASCVDDNAPTPPGTGDGSFVGYSDAAAGQTTCGNCHITKQRQWEATAHRNAWATLQASGGAQAFCARCHTVNGFSNQAPDSAGYFAVAATARPRYHDVQCEACHGPGGPHVQAPDDSQPLTTIAADTGLTIGCGTCHSGYHHPFVAEWRASRHSMMRSSYNNNASCADCHDGRKFIQRIDRDAKFLERDSTNFSPVVCAACHDPHGTDNASQLRLPIDEPNLATNLCMSCHYRRSVPETSNRGPHSPQGPMLMGEAGWRPSTFTYDSTQAVSTHGSERNPRLCAGCHVHATSFTDSTGADITTTGHTFRAIPCVLPNGALDTTNTCTLAQRTFRSCTTSGCHADEGTARNLYATVETRFANYIRQIWNDVNGNDVVDPLPTDSGMLAQVRATAGAGEFTANTTITAAEGAMFNVRLMRMPGNDVHSPFYGEALMLASIDELRRVYALPVPPALESRLRERAMIVGLRRQP